jgi:hypothetical protein
MSMHRDRVLDAGGDERLRPADLGRGPMADEEGSRPRDRAPPPKVAGVLVGGAPRDRRPHSCRDGVKEPSARLTQTESAERLARRVPIGVPVEEHRRVTETASESSSPSGVRPLMQPPTETAWAIRTLLTSLLRCESDGLGELEESVLVVGVLDGCQARVVARVVRHGPVVERRVREVGVDAS